MWPSVSLRSHTFSEVQANSDIYWKFQRYNLIVQYHSRPSLAPPFIILSHINLFIKRNIRKVPSVKIHHFGQYPAWNSGQSHVAPVCVHFCLPITTQQIVLLLGTSSLTPSPPLTTLCSLPVLQLKGKAANRLMTWETIQKEDFLTAQNKIQKSSDSERLKRMSAK